MMKMQKKWIGLLLMLALVMVVSLACAAVIEVEHSYVLRTGGDGDTPGLIMYAEGGQMNLSKLFEDPNAMSPEKQALGKLLFGDSFSGGAITSTHKEHASQFDYKWELDEAALTWDGTKVIKKGYKASFNKPGVFDDYVEAYIQLDYFPGKALANLYAGKNTPLATCTISKDGETVAIVKCMLESVEEGISVLQDGPSTIHEVVTSGSYTYELDTSRYSIPQEYLDGPYKISYYWKAGDRDSGIRIKTTKPEYTFTQEELNRAFENKLECLIQVYNESANPDTDEPVTEFAYHPAVRLHDGRYPYIDMSAERGTAPSVIPAEVNEPVVLRVPAVTASNGGAIEYHWYKHNEDHRPYIHVGTTTQPQLTVAHNSAGFYMYEVAAAFAGSAIPSNGCSGENYAYQNHIFEVSVTTAGDVYYQEVTLDGKARRTVVEPNLNAVPNTMNQRYNLSTMKNDMVNQITAEGEAVGNANMLYEIQLQQHPLSSAVGDQISQSSDWSEVSAGLFPAEEGVEFTIPYPAGTDASTEFSASHIFASEGGDFDVGTIEVLEIVRKTADGIVVKVHGTSPVLLTYTPAAPASTPSVPTTGDNTPIALLCALLLLSAVGVYGMSRKRSA